MIRQSEKIDQLAKAISALQGEVHDVEKDAKGNFSGYATLGAVLSVVRPLLAKHGLALTQFPTTIDGKPGLTTTVMHISGQYQSADAVFLVDKSTMQGLGSAVSYMRRYSATAILGITQVDDDGQSANAPERPPAGPALSVEKKLIPSPTPAKETNTAKPRASIPDHVAKVVATAKTAGMTSDELKLMIAGAFPDVGKAAALNLEQAAVIEGLIQERDMGRAHE